MIVSHDVYTGETVRLPIAPTERLSAPAPRQIPIAVLLIIALILIGAGASLAVRYGDGAAVLAALGCGGFVWLAFGKRGNEHG
jgi:hypothetical protein